MSRRRRGRQTTGRHRALKVNIVCACNRVLGYALKVPTLAEDKRYSLSDSLTWVDVPAPTELSGKIRVKCPDCWRDNQLKWSRVVMALDSLERAGDLAALDDIRRETSGHAVAEIRLT